eukprot:304834-Rhodomonas_salina.6
MLGRGGAAALWIVVGSVLASSTTHATADFYNASSHFSADVHTSASPKLPPLPLSVDGTFIVDAQGVEVLLSCVNWYGAHMEIFTVGGLHKQPLQTLASNISQLGFNCIRLPFSLDLWYEDPVVPEHALAANPAMVGLTG